MAGSIADALYDLLAGDATLAGLLASYRGGPAIFTTQPIPPDAPMPYVLIQPPASDTSIRSLDNNEIGREVERDVSIFGVATGSNRMIQDSAERIRTITHGAHLDVDGFRRVKVRATGPVQLSADSDSYGRQVSLHLRLIR